VDKDLVNTEKAAFNDEEKTARNKGKPKKLFVEKEIKPQRMITCAKVIFDCHLFILGLSDGVVCLMQFDGSFFL
jgi:hypothetical protein